MKEEKPKNEIQVVSFKLGEEEYGIDIHKVREIIRIPKITRVPHAAGFIAGVINLRGEIKTVLNTKKILKMKDDEIRKDGKIIIIEKNRESFGILVDSITGVIKVNKENIFPPEKIISKEASELLKGICRLGERLIILIEPDKFPFHGKI